MVGLKRTHDEQSMGRKNDDIFSRAFCKRRREEREMHRRRATPPFVAARLGLRRLFSLAFFCLVFFFFSTLTTEGLAEDDDPDVKAFPPYGEKAPPSVSEAESNLDRTFRENPGTLSQLFDWAIQNSDRETLRSMAEEMNKRETTGDDGRSNEGTTGGVNSKWSSEALLEKAKNVREMLDQMALHPSEVETLKEITGIFTDGSLDVSERVMALERLDDMVAQIDLAFDFHTILGLKPLLMVVENESEVTEVRAQACQVFATLTSNYEKIQEIAADEFNAVSVLLNATSLAFEKKDETIAKKCLFALTSLTRNVKRLRSEYLFNGEDTMKGKLSHAKYLFKNSLMAPKSVIGDAVWTRTANFLSDIVINAKHSDYNNEEETQLVANLFEDDWEAMDKAARQVQLRFNSPNVSEREASANLALAMIDSKDEAFRNAFKSIGFDVDLNTYEGKHPDDSNEFKHLVRDIQRAFNKKGTHEEL